MDTRTTFVFDKTNPNWTRHFDVNKFFIKSVASHIKMCLREHGYVMLNDALRAYGFHPTSYGAIAGWVFDGKDSLGHVTQHERENTFEIDFDKVTVIFDKIDEIEGRR